MAGLIDIQTWSIIFTIANTVILYLGLKRFLFKPVKELLDKRKAEIESSYAQADEKNAQAESLLAEYQSKLASASSESRELLERARTMAQSRSDEILAEAQSESQRMKERAIRDIEMEKEKALRGLKSEVADMAILATEKLIGKSLDAQTDQALIDEAINEIGDGSWLK